MSKQTGYHRLIIRDKGVFNGRNFSISTDAVTWIPAYAIFITEKGQLFSSDENDNNYLLLQFLQSCYIQIIPNINSAANQQRTKRKTKKDVASDEAVPPVVYIKTFDNEKLYIKVPSKNNFSNLLCSLLVWQNLKPKSLVKKWYCENKFVQQQPDFIHEVLVCRFKIYGPILNKGKNLNIAKGPKVPSYLKNLDPAADTSSQAWQHSQIHESWFYTMGVLKSNGILNFVTELDGTLIYSVDIKNIMSSEIREVHHSLFDNSNVLFLGQIKELRWNNSIKSVSTTMQEQPFPNFLVKDGKSINSYNRVLIEFPLHIDLEDWFVGLNYFSKREYIGSFNPKTALNKSTSSNDILKREETLNDIANLANSDSPLADPNTTSISNYQSVSETSLTYSHQDSMAADTTVSSFPSPAKPQPVSLTNYEREFFRISKKLSIDIIEAKFDSAPSAKSKIYAEVVMWGLPWSRTALVNYTANPFWKEEFATDLPISTQIIHILIKKCSFNENSYSEGDKVIGTVYLTPDILTRYLSDSSTMMIDGGMQGNSINVNGVRNTNEPVNNDIVKLSIYDSSNLPIGKLLLNVNLKEYHILSPKSFKPLENMLHNAPMKDLITFCNQTVSTSEFEHVSLVMLDIFQSLGIEGEWFKELMDAELVNVDKVTRQNYVSNSRSGPNQGNSSSSNNVFNTLFRGSSIFSKSLEKYNLRIGQEYLEKVFGDFFAMIDNEKKNCEVDPRYVRLQEKAERKGYNPDDSDLDDDESDEEEYDSDEENARDQKIKEMVEQNFANLYSYAEQIWNKIYITSNDLPDQIKIQLKHFRNKVELACDPNDKTTALNCLSAFIFLRFFCPAILNPKLFYLTKNHQTGTSQRTLTLIAKILLNLANRQEFSPHKEPHLVKMNSFLEKHKDEVLDYFDKITGRKNDFHEKILDLSHEVKRFDLGLGDDSTSNELPTTPYLIDKYLRLTELIHLLDTRTEAGDDEEDEEDDEEEDDDDDEEDTEVEDEEGPKEQSSVNKADITAALADVRASRKLNNRRTALKGINESDIRIKKNVYQIGSLEFEKSEFLDLAGDDETESFLKSLVKSDENIFSFITSNITLKDLQKASRGLTKRITELEGFLSNYECPSNYQSDQQMWDSFTNAILKSSYVDLNRSCIVQIDDHDVDVPNTYKRVLDSGLSYLKLKFPDDKEMPSEISQTSLSSNLTSSTKTITKNPFKKWFK